MEIPRTRPVVGLLSLLACGFAQGTAAPDQVELDGVIQPSEVLELSAGVLTGMLEDVYVERGDFVEAGQAVARLDARLEEATVELAQARVDSVAALDAARATRDYFAKARDRASSLFEAQVLSVEQLDQAEEEATMAGNRFQVEQEAHLLSRLELQRANVALEMRTIRSPIAGVVVDRLLGPGEAVGQTHLMTIARLDPLWVEVVAPSSLYGSIRTGMIGTVVLEEPIGGAFPARVIVVDQVLDAASNTFGARLELPNPDYALPGGLRGKVRLTLESMPD